MRTGVLTAGGILFLVLLAASLEKIDAVPPAKGRKGETGEGGDRSMAETVSAKLFEVAEFCLGYWMMSLTFRCSHCCNRTLSCHRKMHGFVPPTNVSQASLRLNRRHAGRLMPDLAHRGFSRYDSALCTLHDAQKEIGLHRIKKAKNVLTM